MEPSRNIARLIEIMAALRNPNGGCPWDLKQDFASIAPYTIEEAYEVADAIERNNLADLRDELGDLLLQVVYHARMAEEDGSFAFGDVVEAITDKMIRRHPHVFGDGSAEEANARWEAIKADERREKGVEMNEGHLGDIPRALPALMRAEKLQRRAATVGFDWPDWRPTLDKIKEETAEIEAELAVGDNVQVNRLTDEIGDLLFSVVNFSRHHRIDAEEAMRRANAKFTRRFRAVEGALDASGVSLKEASLEEMEAAWESAKAAERSG